MSYNNTTAELVITDMLRAELITGTNFDIQEHHLNAYIRLYDSYCGKCSITKKIDKNRMSFSLARKLAALTLLKFKLLNGVKATQCKEGFIYTITNPAWQDYVKVGMTIDVKQRLKSYQTYSPLRDYKVESYDFVFDRRNTEKDVFDNFKYSIELGEWIKNTKAIDILRFVRNENDIPNEPSW